MPNPVSDVVADDGAHDAYHEHNVETELSTPHEEAGHEQNGLLGNGDAGIAQDDEDEDRHVTPVGDRRLWVESSGLGGEPTEEGVHADGALPSIVTPSQPVTSRLAWRLRGEGSRLSERNIMGSAKAPCVGAVPFAPS